MPNNRRMACVTAQSINTQYISILDCIFSTKAKRSEIKLKNFVIWWQKDALRYYWSNVISTEITTGIDKTFFVSYIWPNGIDYVDTGFFSKLVILLWSDVTNWNWLLNVKIPRVSHRNCAAKKRYRARLESGSCAICWDGWLKFLQHLFLLLELKTFSNYFIFFSCNKSLYSSNCNWLIKQGVVCVISNGNLNLVSAVPLEYLNVG